MLISVSSTSDVYSKGVESKFVDEKLGNAKIEGLEKDLKMKGNMYNIAVSIFFIRKRLTSL